MVIRVLPVFGPTPANGVNQYGVFLLSVVTEVPFIGVNITLPADVSEISAVHLIPLRQ